MSHLATRDVNRCWPCPPVRVPSGHPVVPLPIRSLTKLATLQERHRELQHQLLGLMGRLQLRRQRGLLVNLEERELHSRLTLMQKELSQPNVCLHPPPSSVDVPLCLFFCPPSFHSLALNPSPSPFLANAPAHAKQRRLLRAMGSS